MALLGKISRARIAYLHDIVMAALSFWVALYLRTGDAFWYYADLYLVPGMVSFTLVAALVFQFSRMYRGIWAYASVRDMTTITKGATIAILVFLPVLFALTRLEEFPRSVPLIHWFVLIALLAGPRFVYRIVKDRRLARILDDGAGARIPVILVGAGDETDIFLRDLARSRTANYTALAIYDDRGRRVGRDIQGVPVVGTLDALGGDLASGRFSPKPQRLVITRDHADGAMVRDLMDLATAHGLLLSRLPRLGELREASPDQPIETRPIAIEDLLGRPQTPLDREGIAAMVAGKRVLVTGAGGSIGAELSRQICALGPAAVTLLDHSEYLLYKIDREIEETHPELPRSAVLGDIRDRARIIRCLSDERPEIVFHAAALKHVPLVEANPSEGILTNCIGSRIVADACQAAGVGCMVQISTDKAVNPTNVMGATKRLAEAYIQALDASGSATRFVVVRFGNVLGSTGSVVPLFRRQIAAGGPVTVTHPDMTRYFMTVREAVELVLQSATLALDNAADTRGKIFVLDMGKPVRILDLADRMIRLSGKIPGEDINIVFTGLRPGEKLFEELLHDDEQRIGGEMSGLTLASPRVADPVVLGGALDQIAALAQDRDRPAALQRLCALVPEYQPDSGARAIMEAAGSQQTAAMDETESGAPGAARVAIRGVND